MYRNTSRVYVNPRPVLQIEFIRNNEKSHHSTYNVSNFRITSLNPLDQKALTKLAEAGLFGPGQSHSFLYMQALTPAGDPTWPVTIGSDKNVKPTAYDTVQCSEIDNTNGNVVRVPSINPYTGNDDKPITIGYYVYVAQTICDSSG